LFEWIVFEWIVFDEIMFHWILLGHTNTLMVTTVL
jgi:hypothetical protein